MVTIGVDVESFVDVLTSHDLEDVMRIQDQSYVTQLQESVGLFQNIISNSSLCFKVVSDGQMNAYLLAYISDLERENFEQGYQKPLTKNTGVYIHDICVSPSCKGRGIASKLLDTLEECMRSTGLQIICGISVQDSLPFWQKRGFKIVDKVSYHGEPAHLIIRRCVLK